MILRDLLHPAFKVPRRILFLAESLAGLTGELRRIGLAQMLGLA